MKRLLTSAALFLCCMTTSFAQFSGSGSGTENDPYLILNPIQQNQLRKFLNMEKVYFKLMADIDLSEFIEDENPSQGWQPVGTSSAPFIGFLDGNGKTVSGLWIKRSNADNVFFWCFTDGASISNLSIIASKIEGNDNVGGISGCSAYSTIYGCSVNGAISGNSRIGGFVGYSNANQSHITLSDNIANVNVSEMFARFEKYSYLPRVTKGCHVCQDVNKGLCSSSNWQ